MEDDGREQQVEEDLGVEGGLLVDLVQQLLVLLQRGDKSTDSYLKYIHSRML